MPKLRAFHEYGGGTFVDATGICNGRDVDYYKSLSAKTGVHIVACTGFVGGDTRSAVLRPGERRVPGPAVHPRDHRGHRRHRQPRRRHQGRREPRWSHDGPRQAHLPRRRPRRPEHRRADPDPPGHRRRDGDRASSARRDSRSTACCSGTPTTASTPSKTRDTWIADQGGRVGFDTFGYETELEDPPFWARPRKERLEHFLRFIDQGYLDKALASADANCSPLGWPGVKGHTVNYIFEDLIPDLRDGRHRRGHDHEALRRQPRRLPDHQELTRGQIQ